MEVMSDEWESRGMNSSERSVAAWRGLGCPQEFSTSALKGRVKSGGVQRGVSPSGGVWGVPKIPFPPTPSPLVGERG